MKCSVFRCPIEASTAALRPVRSRNAPRSPPIVIPELDLCTDHQKRYQSDYVRHFGPLVDNLARKWMVQRGVAKTRVDDVITELTSEGRMRTWQAHWLQMIDLELQHSGKGLYASEVKEEPKPKPRPSIPAKYALLPEHATPEGQMAIAKRAAEEQLLEQRLARETAEFAAGQRQVLQQELKVRREVEARKRKKS